MARPQIGWENGCRASPQPKSPFGQSAGHLQRIVGWKAVCPTNLALGVAFQKVRRQDQTTLACLTLMRAGRLELCCKGGTVATYEIIVTDVTCYGSLFCVAGWDRLIGRMIRPEPPGANAADEASRFWNSGYGGAGKNVCRGECRKFGRYGCSS